MTGDGGIDREDGAARAAPAPAVLAELRSIREALGPVEGDGAGPLSRRIDRLLELVESNGVTCPGPEAWIEPEAAP